MQHRLTERLCYKTAKIKEINEYKLMAIQLIKISSDFLLLEITIF